MILIDIVDVSFEKRWRIVGMRHLFLSIAINRYLRSSRVTFSTWWVWGNISTG